MSILLEPGTPPQLTLDDIDTGISVVEHGRRSRLDDREELELVAVKLRNELSKSYIENVNADRDMRKKYASRILRYLEIYSGTVGAVLMMSGFHPSGFQLPNEILAYLVGSTAVAAIGLVGFIARGLFRTPPTQSG